MNTLFESLGPRVLKACIEGVGARYFEEKLIQPLIENFGPRTNAMKTGLINAFTWFGFAHGLGIERPQRFASCA